MFKKFFTAMIALTLVAAAFAGVTPAFASARTASWTVSITYQNVGAANTPVTVYFYPEGSDTYVTFDAGTLNAGAGTSLYIGSVTGLSTGFRGNAVMAASEPLIATVVQFSQDPGFKMRLLSNGFQSTDGSTQYLVPTTLERTFNRTTVFSVQNIEASPVTATIKFYDANTGANTATVNHTIPGNSSKYIEMDDPSDTNLGSLTSFNGSAIITVPSGAIVSAASEMYTNQNMATNFEGLPLSRAANSVYMATALCGQFGMDTFYAVQNTSLSTSTNISVQYKDVNGLNKSSDGPYTLGPGQKKSIITCTPSDGTPMNLFTGSAVITSTSTPIVAMGKAQCQQNPHCGPSTTQVFTAFLGEPGGSTALAAPFIRYANNTNFNSASNSGGKQRSFLAIQNLESSQIMVDVEYYGKDGGGPLATETLTIPAFSKGSSNPSTAGALGLGGMNAGEFGYYPGGLFGGSVVIRADSSNPSAEFIAIVRVTNPGAAEDYNAVPIS